MAYIAIAHKNDHGFVPHDILWECSREAAIAVCSDERTAGPCHFLMWFDNEPSRGVNWVTDNGLYDDVLAELGLYANGHKLVGREPVQSEHHKES